MKSRFVVTLICLCTLTLLPACGTTTQSGANPAAAFTTPAAVQSAAQLSTTSALAFIKSPDERKQVAGEAYSAAAALRSLSGGTAPTVGQVQDTIKAFGGSELSPAYALLAGELAALYAPFYQSLAQHGDAAANAKVVAYLEALAEGVEAGAGPYR